MGNVTQVSVDKVGNTRLGIACGLRTLDESLGSRDLKGQAWYVDYEGRFQHNINGRVRTLAQLAGPLETGDSVAFILDLRPLSGGRLSVRHKGASRLLVADLPNATDDLRERPYFPAFCLDNIDERLSLDFVIDGHAGLDSAASVSLQLPEASELEAVFARIDEDNTGFLSLGEIAVAMHALFPEHDNRTVVLRAFRASDRAGNGRLDRWEFRHFFDFLLKFEALNEMFILIDSSGDARLSFEEFKTGVRLLQVRVMSHIQNTVDGEW
jgi:hypothetical protein